MRKRAAEIEWIELWCQENKGRYTLQQIKSHVNLEFELKNGELEDASKASKYRDARLCFSWFSIQLSTNYLIDIAESVDRSHSAISRSYRNANGLLDIGDVKLTNHIINIHTLMKTFQ